MASVARAAGVGIATLFRRFPTRDDLINAVFACTMNTYLDAVTTALGDPDPWHGFTSYIHTVCAMQAADRGFAEVLTMTFPTAPQLEDQRQRACSRPSPHRSRPPCHHHPTPAHSPALWPASATRPAAHSRVGSGGERAHASGHPG